MKMTSVKKGTMQHSKLYITKNIYHYMVQAHLIQEKSNAFRMQLVNIQKG